MSAPGSVPVDVVAILTDLQQQVSDLTGIIEAQQQALDELSRLARPQDRAAGQPSPDYAPAGPGGV